MLPPIVPQLATTHRSLKPHDGLCAHVGAINCSCWTVAMTLGLSCRGRASSNAGVVRARISYNSGGFGCIFLFFGFIFVFIYFISFFSFVLVLFLLS